MSPEIRHRNAAIVIAFAAVVVMSVLVVPAIISPPPQRKLVYEYSTLNAQTYPAYHRAYITIDAPADLYVEFTISNVQDSEHYQYFWSEFYGCDPATFDSHFSTNTSDPIYQDFRTEYSRFSVSFTGPHRDAVIFEDAPKGSYTFVWWICARNKVNSWPLSFKLYLQYK